MTSRSCVRVKVIVQRSRSPCWKTWYFSRIFCNFIEVWPRSQRSHGSRSNKGSKQRQVGSRQRQAASLIVILEPCFLSFLSPIISSRSWSECDSDTFLLLSLLSWRIFIDKITIEKIDTVKMTRVPHKICFNTRHNSYVVSHKQHPTAERYCVTYCRPLAL